MVDKTCYNCGAFLLNNQLVKNAYNCNNSAIAANNQLLIIADMLEENEDKKWHADKIRKYCGWIKCVDD